MRKLLVSFIGGALILSGLTGCADPLISGTPPVPSIDAGFSANITKATDEIALIWNAVKDLGDSDPQDPKWGYMESALESMWLVLTGPDPLHRIPSARAKLQVTPVGLDKDATSELLVNARDANIGRAEASSGLEAVFWASIACGLDQVRLGLTRPYGEPIAPDSTATIAIQDMDAAVVELIARYHEAVFALKPALGFLDSKNPNRANFEQILNTVQADLEKLIALAHSLDITPPPSAGVYELPAGRDTAASYALVAISQQSLVEASAVLVASSTNPSSTISYLMTNATLGLPLGIGTAVWPGWPDGTH
ncbi:MAG: ferritin-like domain-containing protein [Propionibacteriaceae bacterium]|nr:ferritin-like domain-containing protein [Propionibacteriaceae bacterium]